MEDVKNRKEFKKVSFILKTFLRKMYKKYGYELTLVLIDGMESPTINEKCLMKEYIKLLNSKAERK